MYISRVEINGFLSFKDFDVTLDPNTNIIVGTNGTGKSNFLRLIHYTINDSEQIMRYGADDDQNN